MQATIPLPHFRINGTPIGKRQNDKRLNFIIWMKTKYFRANVPDKRKGEDQEHKV